METIKIKLNKGIADEAVAYARQRGTDLSSMIESYLIRVMRQEKVEEAIPDIIQSLLGAGEPVEQDDLNARKAYHRHLEEKFK